MSHCCSVLRVEYTHIVHIGGLVLVSRSLHNMQNRQLAATATLQSVVNLTVDETESDKLLFLSI